ncbi:MAG: CBS domain-containing protein [Myxococcota bacterium]
MGHKVRDVMTRNPLTMLPKATMLEAATSMRDANIGDVLVVDGDSGPLRGILTDRDIVVRGLAEGLDPSRTTLDDLCSHRLVTISPDEEYENAVRVMREARVRRLPVMENGRAVGIVSLGDLAVWSDPHSVLGEISAAPPNR